MESRTEHGEIFFPPYSVLEKYSTTNVQFVQMTIPLGFSPGQVVYIRRAGSYVKPMVRNPHFHRLEILQGKSEMPSMQELTVGVSTNAVEPEGLMAFGVMPFSNRRDSLRTDDFIGFRWKPKECRLSSEDDKDDACQEISGPGLQEFVPPEGMKDVRPILVNRVTGRLEIGPVWLKEVSLDMGMQVWTRNQVGLDGSVGGTFTMPVVPESGIRVGGFTLDLVNGLQVMEEQMIVPAWPPFHIRVKLPGKVVAGGQQKP